MLDTVNIVGFPLPIAEALLKSQSLAYEIEMTRPTKKFFPVDESRLYVVRQRRTAAGSLHLMAAAGPRKEV